MTDDVLEPFEDEVRQRDSIWKSKGIPRMEARRHRNGTTTRVLVRSQGHREVRDDKTVRIRGVTVHFTDREWEVLTRAVLAGLGLAPTEEDKP